jgi:lysophospholipase L1-like esterase
MLPLALALVVAQPPADPFAKWEKEVAGIEKRLAANPPKPGGVLFAGSSTIRLWDTKAAFPDLAPTNVGFGGSQIPDSTHFAGRLILPHKPATIVFYAGDNDIAAKRTPEQVRDDFRAFADTVHKTLPDTRILFLAIKPSVKRWNLYDVQTKANALVKAVCDADRRLKYIDTVPLTVGADGKPDPALFREDGLHLSAKGYAAWAAAVRAALR